MHAIDDALLALRTHVVCWHCSALYNAANVCSPYVLELDEKLRDNISFEGFYTNQRHIISWLTISNCILSTGLS